MSTTTDSDNSKHVRKITSLHNNHGDTNNLHNDNNCTRLIANNEMENIFMFNVRFSNPFVSSGVGCGDHWGTDIAWSISEGSIVGGDDADQNGADKSPDVMAKPVVVGDTMEGTMEQRC